MAAYYAKAPTATIVDDWASGSINSSTWLNWGSTNVSVVNQELKMLSTLGGGYYGIDSDVSGKMYNMTNSSVVNQVVNAGNQSLGTWEVYPLYVYPEGDDSYQYYFYISENTLKAYKKVDGSDVQLASTSYNSANHKWFRIREASGTTYFDTSADGGTWANFTSTANEFEALAVGVGAMVGTWDTESSTTSATFDNFNVWHPVYAYDANGNMTSDGSKCYTYNEANQLSKVQECGNSHTIAEYVYDYTGLRMIKKNYVTGTISNTVVSWSDGYETKTPVGGSAQNTTYYWVNKELLAKKDNSGNRLYYQNDHLGSSSLLTNSSGNVAELTKYDPWGEVTTGGTMSKFQYTGQEKDSETGLNYYNARYYSSDMRRFTQPDSIIQDVYNPQDLNRYSYVRNNPLKYTDPSGHFAFLAIPAVQWITSALVSTAAIYFSTPQGQQVTKTAISTVANAGSQLISQAKSAVSNYVSRSSPATSTPKSNNSGGSSGGGSSNQPSGGGNPFSKIAPILPPIVHEGGKNWRTNATINQGLRAAESWLGKGYKEIDDWVFRSTDELRQFRMTNRDILTKEPHFNLEKVGPDGKRLLDNLHIYLKDFNK